MADTRPRRRRKHSRARTGCLTCRKRRIKCDERKPTCSRCDIGSRECTYPSMLGPIRLSSVHLPAQTYLEGRPRSSSSELSPGDCEEQVEKSAVVMFQPGTRQGDDRWVDTQSFHELLFPPAVTLPSSHEIPASLYCQGFPWSAYGVSVIPRSPRTSQAQSVQFFLKYHQRSILPQHYFKCYDYHDFCKGWLPAMAEQSHALRHAMVSFSALIYSMNVNSGARYVAFYYYSVALKELRLLLNEDAMTSTECNIAIATALQLSTIDRFFGDVAKCFRHLEGIVQILHNFSSPLRQSATMLGRSLLELYCNLEDYCCLLSAHKLLLPRIWRYENVRERLRLAEQDYPRLSQSERKARILDDLYPQLWALYPQLADVFVTIPTFKVLDGSRRSKAVARLNQQLRQFEEELQEFMCSPLVEEVLEQVEQPVTLNAHHSECCPPLPFIPYIFRFPPAGFLRLVLFSLHNYMHVIPYPLLRAEGKHRTVTSEFEDIDKREAMAAAYEQCRSFAGLEDAFGENQDYLFPCFSPLALAGSCCSPGLRMWLWYKLAHFENLGQFSTVGIKKHLSVWWDMPNLATDGFGKWKGEPPKEQIRVLSVEDVDLATKMTNLDIEERTSVDSEPLGPDPEGGEF